LALLILASTAATAYAAPSTPAAGPSLAQQIAAATATAQTNPTCSRTTLGDYYWELGDASGPLVSGTTGTTVAATTAIPIDSASKWIYSTYVVQTFGGTVPASQVPFLNFTSGYTGFGTKGALARCVPSDTVASCLARNNVTQNPDSTGRFYYDSGHLQVHANMFMGQGPSIDSVLTTSILTPTFNMSSRATLGYGSVLIAASIYTSGSNYGAFLRRILTGELLMKNQLGTNKVCTNRSTCASAIFSPMQTTGESWNYSLGHWVEDDPVVGDHAFSSAGASGFYPWIDQTKTYYGVISRQVNVPGTNQGFVSAQCGRMIRQAFATGVATTSATPTPSR
jgi:hypothetical protein